MNDVAENLANTCEQLTKLERDALREAKANPKLRRRLQETPRRTR